MGGAGGGYASQLSSHREGSGEITQVSSPLYGEGQGEVPQVISPLPWGGDGGGFLLFSFTNAFAGRGVLRNKRIAVGNTRVLGLLATR